jgi:hypothetical protein
MKRLIPIIFALLMLSGCAADWMIIRQNDLEKEIAQLKQQQGIPGSILQQAELTGAAVKFRGFTGTTGSAAGDLDSLGCATAADGDYAIVIDATSKTLTFYKYNSTGTTAENDPPYIAPDDRAANCGGEGVWELSTDLPIAGKLMLYNSSGELVQLYLHENGGWTFDGLNAGGIWMYPASGFDLNIVPTAEGDGFTITDVDSDTSITMHVPNNTTTLKLTGSHWITDDLIFDTDSKISHATDGDYMTFKTAASVPYLYLNAPIENIATVDLDEASDYMVADLPALDCTSAPTAASVTVASTCSWKGTFYNSDNDAIGFSLPADPTGKEYCFHAGEFAQVITITPDASDYVTLDGTKAAQGEAIVSSGAAGEFICIHGKDTGNWYTWGYSGTWAEASP